MVQRRFLPVMSAAATAVALFLAVPAAMRAQTAPAPPPTHQAAPLNPENQMQRLAKRLNLTPTEQKQMLPVLQNRDQQIMALRSS